MMNLAQLQSQAQTLRRQPMNDATRAALEGLRKEAAQNPVVAQALDRHLQVLFHDVYGGKPPPPVSLTSAGAAQSATFGGARGSALQFHALQQAMGAGGLEKAVSSKIPQLKSTTATPIPLDEQFPVRSPAEKKQVRTALEGELADVRVFVGGKRMSLLDRIRDFKGLAPEQKERILDVLADVRAGYATVGLTLGDKPGGVAYQDVNWKHTRLEVDRVLSVVESAKLSPAQAEVALLASIVSDAVKTPGNFLVHNVHGAQAGVKLLARMTPPPSKEMLEDVAKATLEHQIGPPGFMANVAMRNALKGAGVDGGVIATICDKIAHPLDKKNLVAGGSEIAFTPAEKAALEKVGVFHWTVPHEGSRHFASSNAVIAGDSLVNYACPDGWAKLAALHGPDQPPFLQEPRLVDALLSEKPEHASALKSYRDAQSVIAPEMKGVYQDGFLRTKLAVERMTADLERWVKMQPQKDVPRTKDGKIPYLDGALDYANPQQVAFARKLRDHAVTFLRQQEAL
jgi:hypothetical protein